MSKFFWSSLAVLVSLSVHAVPGRVTILHTNDTHAHVDDGSVSFSEISAEKARLVAQGEKVILCDAGDYVQGTALGGFDEGRTVIEIMNAAGYDVATLGNHEFDYGIPAMLRNLQLSAFKNTSCNFLQRKSADDPGKLLLQPYVVVTNGDVRVGFVGVTTPTALVSAKPSTFLDPTGTYRAWDFIAGKRGEELYAAVQSAVNDAAKVSDYVVVLGHLGVSPESANYMSTDVIAHTTNFIAFVDGHSHSEYTGRLVRNAAGRDVVLTQSGSYLGVLGFLTLENGKCVAAGTIYPRGDKDQKVVALEKRLAADVEKQLGVRIAIADTALCAYAPGTTRRLARSQGCGAGDFAADAALWYANEKAGLACDFALMNGGNVRADIPAGDVTLKAMREMSASSRQRGVRFSRRSSSGRRLSAKGKAAVFCRLPGCATPSTSGSSPRCVSTLRGAGPPVRRTTSTASTTSRSMTSGPHSGTNSTSTPSTAWSGTPSRSLRVVTAFPCSAEQRSSTTQSARTTLSLPSTPRPSRFQPMGSRICARGRPRLPRVQTIQFPTKNRRALDAS